MTVEMTYSSSLYPKEAIIGAAYSLTDEFYVHLDLTDGRYIFRLTPKDGGDNGEYTRSRADNELVSQLARYVVSEKTKDIRRIMIARAFASSVLEEEADMPEYAPEYISDVKKILKDWFESDG